MSNPRRRGPKVPFELISDFSPCGDQPEAIRSLVEGLNQGLKHQVLMGVTGSGKSFTVANTIAQTGRPALVLAPNKTLAAQLYAEFRSYFPNNAVEYFVSYYDYYQPEAYVASSDTYIEKDSSVNERIDKLRHSATRSLLEREDVIIVASVSCIYGLGSPDAYSGMLLHLQVGDNAPRDQILAKLVEIQYTRNDLSFHRGTFRVRGDIIEVYPAHEDEVAIRIELWGDEVEAINLIDPLRGQVVRSMERCAIYPASHYVTEQEQLQKAVQTITDELEIRLADMRRNNRLLEAQRLEQRTNFDLEMLEEMGYCNGIENYSRHLTGRDPGDPPPCLLDFFAKDWVMFIDESHISVSQVRAMYRGDQARKSNLVEHGFRLPSAMDNRPLKFEEFNDLLNQAIYISATPGDYEMEEAGGVIVEQIIRPTGLLDPQIEVRPAETQVDDLLHEVRLRVERNERVLITTLTKRMAEDLSTYYADLGVRVRYLHSDIDTLERIQIIQDLRVGEFDVLVGINLLREGLDLPEVSLVAILDADKEGFLRSERSLIQTVGRAARNAEGRVIFYADKVTRSMEACLKETTRRRAIQQSHNEVNGITPTTVIKSTENELLSLYEDPSSKRGKRDKGNKDMSMAAEDDRKYVSGKQLEKDIEKLKKEMMQAAGDLNFELAAELRDRIKKMEQALVVFGGAP